jgi:hypothetical protein
MKINTFLGKAIIKIGFLFLHLQNPKNKRFLKLILILETCDLFQL